MRQLGTLIRHDSQQRRRAIHVAARITIGEANLLTYSPKRFWCVAMQESADCKPQGVARADYAGISSELRRCLATRKIGRSLRHPFFGQQSRHPLGEW